MIHFTDTAGDNFKVSLQLRTARPRLETAGWTEPLSVSSRREMSLLTGYPTTQAGRDGRTLRGEW